MPKQKITVLFILMVILIQSAGCKNNSNINWNASCRVVLEDIPEEYYMLTEGIRNDISIRVKLRSTTGDHEYSVYLSEENEFNEVVDVLPGHYHVDVATSESDHCMFEVHASVSEFDIKKDSSIKLSMYLTEPNKFAETMQQNQGTAEILQASLFSRMVQYQGKIIDLNNITKYFSILGKTTSLKPEETITVGTSQETGVSIILQNQTNSTIEAKDATVIGVLFRKNIVVFPKGVVVGTEVARISHTEKGLFGKPTYCLGSPWVGYGSEEVSVVYLDENSGDRVTFILAAGETYVGSIKYEFAQYE